MKYKKKPLIIDAVQWTGKNHREMFNFLTQDTFKEESMEVSGDHFYIDHNKVEGGLIIKTLEGEHLATIGDYIIRGVQGEYYPCKEDIFHQTYEIYSDGKLIINDNGYWGNSKIIIPSDTTTTHITSLSNKPEPNGVPCPICGEELMDSNPMMILTSDPAQKNVHCPSCDYRGYRTI